MFSVTRTPRSALRALVGAIDGRTYPAAFYSRRLASTSGDKPALCPSCSAPLPTPLPACPACRQHIHPVPNDINKHAIFGLPDIPNPFVVDTAALKHRFREVQRVIHPDAWSGNEKQDIARQLSALVNGSYKTLLSPLKRAEYILERNGHPMSETDQLSDPEFIMEVMEVREAVEEATSQEEVQAIVDENKMKINKTLKDIEEHVGIQDWPAVKTAAIRLKYLEGIDTAANAWPETASDH